MPGEALDNLSLRRYWMYYPGGLTKYMATPQSTRLALERTGREARGIVRIQGQGVKSCARPGLLGDSLICAALLHLWIPDLGSRQGYLRPGELFRCGPGPGRKSVGQAYYYCYCAVLCTVQQYYLLTDDVIMMGSLVILTGRGSEGVVWVRRGRERKRSVAHGSGL